MLELHCLYELLCLRIRRSGIQSENQLESSICASLVSVFGMSSEDSSRPCRAPLGQQDNHGLTPCTCSTLNSEVCRSA